MKRSARAASAVVIAAILTTLGVVPAVGVPGGTHVGGEFVEAPLLAQNGDESWDVDWDRLSTEPVPYVEADSPQEAIEIFDSLESNEGLARTSAASVNYGPCKLHPSVVYFRTSSNKGAVGFKPYTKCSNNVTSIPHESTLRYEYFGLWLVALNKTGGNRGVMNYTQKNIEYYCLGNIDTDFGGTTLGTIVYLGRTYYARVYTPRVELGCTV